MYLLSKFSRWSEDKPKYFPWEMVEPIILFQLMEFGNDGSCKGKGLSWSSLSSYKEVMIVSIVGEYFCLYASGSVHMIVFEGSCNLRVDALEIGPALV